MENIKKLARNENDLKKVKLLLNELFPDENIPVPDPYYGTMSDFESVYKLLDQATDMVIKNIKNGAIR